MPRGRGKKPPANPAPVSNLPGRLAQRSDGGPAANMNTPFNAEAHGDRQDFAALQAAGGPPSSPSAAPGGPGPSPAPGPPGGLPPGVPTGDPGADVFGPSSNPGATPASTGTLPSQIPDDPDMMLRVMYAAFPHPDLLRLIQRRTGL